MNQEYEVTIKFKKGPEFSGSVHSENNEESAKSTFLEFAKKCGFDEPVKKITAKLVK